MTELSDDKADERKIRITRIESVGDPTERSAKAPVKETDECPKNELTGEMFCYQRKKIHEELKKNGKHAIVYNPKRLQGH